jgi:hypothetical protein
MITLNDRTYHFPMDAKEVIGETKDGYPVYTIEDHPQWVGVAYEDTSNTYGGQVAEKVLDSMTPY